MTVLKFILKIIEKQYLHIITHNNNVIDALIDSVLLINFRIIKNEWKYRIKGAGLKSGH